MDFHQKLKLYSQLIVQHGLNVQRGQVVNIGCEAILRDFAIQVAEECYKQGAKYVNLDLGDPRLARTRILASSMEDLEYVPQFISTKYNDFVTDCSANLRILGSEAPDILADLEPKKVNAVRKSFYQAVKPFYDDGIGKSKVHWTIAAGATPQWGQKIFPDLAPQEAESKLWDAILSVCRADKENCLELWKAHNQKLHERSRLLSALKISTLHFTGPGTDLKVGLSPQALFKGGSDASPRKVEFEPNIPTEEVFTTPDWRRTEGHVRATRPFLVNGVMIRDLVAEFKAGELVSFTASSGKETFEEYTKSDAGGRRLGEVALVGIDSPVFKSNLVFQEILFDENAACHIAVGSAYKFCLENGANLTEDEVDALGCNESSVHTDMMISDENVDVIGTTYAGESVLLIEKGNWKV